MERRQALAVIGAGSLAVVAYRLIGGGGMTARGLSWPRGLSPVVTPTADFYQVSKNALLDPRVDAGRWRLDVHGQVSRPLALSLDDLRAMPVVEQPATLACIGNAVPARAIGNARWTGVRLADVLAGAGAAPSIEGRTDVIFTGADNYTDSIPFDRATHPGALLAYEMNGEPLTRGHGAPLRAIVPGIYGMKNVKWIEAIAVASGDYLGYWQQRGWSDAAPYRTLSRIDEPRMDDVLRRGTSLQVAGIAFAGDRGVSRVELSIASAPRGERPLRPGEWTPAAVADLEAPLGPYTWVRWTWPWTPEAAGVYEIAVRAADGTGTPQPRDAHPSFPDGATGLHRIRVTVSG